MKKVLIVGAGYVGMALLQVWQGKGIDVVVTTTDPARVRLLESFGKVVLLDRRDDSRLACALEECDWVVILIAPKGGQNYRETYLEMAQQIARAIKGRRHPLHLLYTGSTSVCEGSTAEWVTEETLLFPQTERGKILLATERLYLESSATSCILRLGGIYGPGRELAARAGRVAGQQLSGTGTEATNHIHLDDVVEAIKFSHAHTLKGLYHLVNDDHPSRSELYGALCRQRGLPPPIWGAASDQGHVGGYKVCNCKIKAMGFTFGHPHLY